MPAAGVGLAEAGAPRGSRQRCGAYRGGRGTIYTPLIHVLPCCIIHTFLAEDKNFTTANVQVSINVEAARQTSDLEEALEKEPKSVLCKQIFFLKATAWWVTGSKRFSGGC